MGYGATSKAVGVAVGGAFAGEAVVAGGGGFFANGAEEFTGGNREGRRQRIQIVFDIRSTISR